MEKIQSEKSKVTLSLKKPTIDLGKELSKRSGKSLSAIAEHEILNMINGDLEKKLKAFHSAKGIVNLTNADQLETKRSAAIKEKHGR